MSNRGLNLSDMEFLFNAQKIKWVKALLEPKMATWKIIPQFYLEKLWKQFPNIQYEHRKYKQFNRNRETARFLR